MLKRRGTRHREIISLCISALRHMMLRQCRNFRRQFRRVEPAGIDEHVRAKFIRPVSFRLDGMNDKSIAVSVHGHHLGVECDHCIVRLRIAKQRQHQIMAINDSGRRGHNRGRAVQFRLDATGLRSGKELQITHTAPAGAPGNFGQGLNLLVISRNDQFAAALMRHAVCIRKPVKRGVTFHTELRLQTGFGVIEAGVNDTGIAGTYSTPHRTALFGDERFNASSCKFPRYGNPDNATTRNNAAYAIHSSPHCRFMMSVFSPDSAASL